MLMLMLLRDNKYKELMQGMDEIRKAIDAHRSEQASATDTNGGAVGAAAAEDAAKGNVAAMELDSEGINALDDAVWQSLPSDPGEAKRRIITAINEAKKLRLS